MSRVRRGFSLVEMLVAMTITMAVFAITLPFVRAQTRSLGSTAGRMDADQVARFAMRAVEQDLRRAAGEYGQPTLVAAGPMLLSFNANLRRADSLDVTALETEVIGMAAGAAWPLARAAAIPTTARTYPTADYVNVDGDTTRTETVTYFLEADSTDATGETFTLRRQFNDQAPLDVVEGLYLPDSQVFFSYFRNVNGYLAEIPEDTAVFWTMPRIHEIRTVGLRASGRYVNKFDNSEFVRTIETRVTLPVVSVAAECGTAPSPVGGSPSAAVMASGARGVALAWAAAPGDTTGAYLDDWHYLLERRPSGGQWRRLAVVSARDEATYGYVDYVGDLAGSVEYGVSVVGCGAVPSTRVSMGTVTP